MEMLAVLEPPVVEVSLDEAMAVRGVESARSVALPVAIPVERPSESAVFDEDAALDKALKAVEGEQYLRQVRLEVDVAMLGFCVNPFDPR